MIAEEVFCYVISLKPRLVMAYLEATESLVDPALWITIHILYYALILPVSKEYGPFVEFISSVHSILDICLFLDIGTDIKLY